MLNIKTTRSRILVGFSFAILLTSFGFFGCGTNSSSTLDVANIAASTVAASNDPRAVPVSVSVDAASLPIPIPAVPTPITAGISIQPTSGGQVQVTLPASSSTPAVGNIVTIGNATTATGSYNGSFTVVASNPTTQTFTITAPNVGSPTTTPVVQPQIVATPVVGIAPSTTTGQATIAASNTLTNGAPITISGSSIPALNGPNTAINPTPTTVTITTTYVPLPVPPAGTAPAPLPAGTNLGVIQTGGGVAAAAQCTTTATGTAGAITLPKSALDMDTVASRLTGVAPLAVFFDTTGTTATATTKPFHDLEYRWNFGDDDTLTWANGAHVGDGSVLAKKNRATGPVAAHVFETPGTYIVNLSVTDGTNTVSNGCVQIAVQDPNLVFAGANTVCIANSTATAGSGGCPAGAATPPGTAVFDTALSACVGTTKRCLFNRSDKFTSTADGSITVAGPITIGAYGTGALPVVNVTNHAVFKPVSSAVNDLRIMDLEIVGSSSTTAESCMNVSALVNNITVLRLSCHDINTGIIVSSGSEFIGTVIQDSHIYNLNGNGKGNGGMGIFGYASNSAYLGNYIGPINSGAEHIVRLQPGQKVAISNNTLTTPGSTGKTVLTIRGSDHATGAANDPINDTQYIYVSDNKLMGGPTSVQMFQIAPAANNQNDWAYDVIAERNWIILGSVAQQGLYSEATRLTIRNNVCDATASGGTCFSNDHTNTSGTPTPDDNRFYNNTCYSGSALPLDCVILSYSGYAGNPIITTNAVVANNLAYAPSATSPKMLTINNGASGTIGANGTLGNSSNAQVLGTNPNWLNASGLFNSPLDFKLPASSSYAIGGGVAVPVWSDFFLVTQPATRDIGAVNH